MAVSPLPATIALALPGLVLVLAVVHVFPNALVALLAFLLAYGVCVGLYLVWVPLFRWDLSNDRVVASEIDRIAASHDPTDRR